MRFKIFVTMMAMLFVVGGITMAPSAAWAHCGKCGTESKHKVCKKCQRAGKKTCNCHAKKAKKKVCDHCRKAGKKVCGCKHKH